eukprot:15453451-Alexandrium_andersonii.AAC.1
MGTLARSDFRARGMIAAVAAAEEQRRAQSALPARKRAVGSVDANPVAPKRGASAPKRVGQTEHTTCVPEWGAQEFLEPAAAGP